MNFCWDFQFRWVRSCDNLVDLEKCCKMSILLETSPSIQPRTSLSKFGRNFSISPFSSLGRPHRGRAWGVGDADGPAPAARAPPGERGAERAAGRTRGGRGADVGGRGGAQVPCWLVRGRWGCNMNLNSLSNSILPLNLNWKHLTIDYLVCSSNFRWLLSSFGKCFDQSYLRKFENKVTRRMWNL